jgi:DNA-binding response OmpR family regulator
VVEILEISTNDEDTATSVSLLLRLHGYAVEVAMDGPSACQAIQTSLPDVVWLNIGLPKMSGWLVAKQIREQSVWKRPLMVAMTVAFSATNPAPAPTTASALTHPAPTPWSP